jgi:hypothetical protein
MTTRCIITACILLISAAGASDSIAQHAELQRGKMIRVTTTQKPSTHRGFFVSMSDTTIVYSPVVAGASGVDFAPVSLALSEMTRVEVGTRRSATLQGAGIGLTVGAAFGALLGAASWNPCTSTEFLGCFMHPASAGEQAQIGMFAGGLAGLVIGALIGAHHAVYTWQPITLHVQPVGPSAGVVILFR